MKSMTCMTAIVSTVVASIQVFPKAIVHTTNPCIGVKRTYTLMRGLLVGTVTLGKIRVSATILSAYFE